MIALLMLVPMMAVERPAITGVANFVVKTDSLVDARKFYTGVLGYDEVFSHQRPGVNAPLAVFKVNERQYIEVAPTLQNETEDRMIQIGFETKNARQLRAYLAEKRVTVPKKLKKDADGNWSFAVKDPEGHTVEFVEYVKGGLHGKHAGKGLSAKRVSDHMLHVGVHVKNPEAQNKFYRDILGFRFQWQGGPQDDRVDWMSMMVPDGDNWIEYMVSHGTAPTPRQLAVWHHVGLGTVDIQGLYKTVVARDYKPQREPNIARDGRWLLQLYDKHNTRSEIMVRKPVQKPCCSENKDPYVK
jgi:catechol 2,3-dioxygenase-like lactoylglutathione lyase family enzyme